MKLTNLFQKLAKLSQPELAQLRELELGRQLEYQRLQQKLQQPLPQQH